MGIRGREGKGREQCDSYEVVIWWTGEENACECGMEGKVKEERLRHTLVHYL